MEAAQKAPTEKKDKNSIVVVRKFCGEKSAEQIVLELLKAHLPQS